MTLIQYRVSAILLPLVILIASLVLINQASTHLKTHKTNLDQIVINNQSLEEATSFNQFLSANTPRLEQISAALPSESMMVGVVQDLESVVRHYDQNGSIKIAAATPAKIGADLVIPLTITTVTDSSQIVPLIADLIDLPYIMQLIKLDTQFTNSTAQSIINLRMYVQDPFIGY